VRSRPWLGAVGLRGQIAGALLVTAVGALAVAAVVLLGPLEHSLRTAAESTLKQQVPWASTVASFKKVDPSYAAYYASTQGTSAISNCDKPTSLSTACVSYRKGKNISRQLRAEESAISLPIGGPEVALLDFSGASGAPPQWVVAYPDFDLERGDPADDARKAFRTHKPQYTLGTVNGAEYARAALPFMSHGPAGTPQRWVLIVRKSLSEVSSAVAAVRTAFLVAALVALALTVMLGIPLSARIVRRLRVLRQAAVRLANEGPSVEVPVDRAMDEVGDLARSFALMQRRLLHQEQARRTFVATASHELRTPLATLDGMLEMLDEDLRSGDLDLADAQDLIDRARAQSRRLGRLAADLLDLSRLDAEIELRSEPVELAELSRAVLAEFELGTADRAITTVLDDQSGPVWALGDPGSVARILRILLDNAVRLSPEGGEVTVELRNGKAASLSVCDQGPGVPEPERDLIFERFMRGRETTRQVGFGLGLAIGRELAERMGGELVLEAHDGQGARFTLRLPVAQAPEIEPLAVT
jgi:signal transduction histidine kinase